MDELPRIGPGQPVHEVDRDVQAQHQEHRLARPRRRAEQDERVEGEDGGEHEAHRRAGAQPAQQPVHERHRAGPAQRRDEAPGQRPGRQRGPQRRGEEQRNGGERGQRVPHEADGGQVRIPAEQDVVAVRDPAHRVGEDEVVGAEPQGHREVADERGRPRPAPGAAPAPVDDGPGRRRRGRLGGSPGGGDERRTARVTHRGPPRPRTARPPSAAGRGRARSSPSRTAS